MEELGTPGAAGGGLGVLQRALTHSFHSLGIPRGFQDKKILPAGSCHRGAAGGRWGGGGTTHLAQPGHQQERCSDRSALTMLTGPLHRVSEKP